MPTRLPATPRSHSARNIFAPQSNRPPAQQPQGGVGQDNPAPPRERIGTMQPASQKKLMRTHITEKNIPRSQKQFNTKRKTVPVTLWMSPGERAELQRVAEAKGLSLSQTGRAFVASM